MNKKVDEEFKYIHDEYILQCTCTEMKDKINNLQSKIEKVIEYLSKNNVSLNEFTKDFEIIPTNIIMIEFLKGERKDILKEDK